MKAPYFATMDQDPACPYCAGRTPYPDWSFVDAAYCISLQERSDRTALAAKEFHRVGLCGLVTFYRPTRPTDGKPPRVAIWESHKAVVRDALRKNCRRVLIFEDDVVFVSSKLDPQRIARAMTRLPPDAYGLFLGHWPVSGWFTGWGLMKVKSGLAHALIANRPLLELLDQHEPVDPRLSYNPLFGKGIDAVIGNLDGMFAMFPMVAVQRPIESDNLSARTTGAGHPRKWNDKLRYRIFLIQRMPRAAEIFCALASPLHWLRDRMRAKRRQD